MRALIHRIASDMLLLQLLVATTVTLVYGGYEIWRGFSAGERVDMTSVDLMNRSSTRADFRPSHIRLIGPFDFAHAIEWKVNHATHTFVPLVPPDGSSEIPALLEVVGEDGLKKLIARAAEGAAGTVSTVGVGADIKEELEKRGFHLSENYLLLEVGASPERQMKFGIILCAVSVFLALLFTLAFKFRNSRS